MWFLLLLVHVKIHRLGDDTVFTAVAIIRPLELTQYLHPWKRHRVNINVHVVKVNTNLPAEICIFRPILTPRPTHPPPPPPPPRVSERRRRPRSIIPHSPPEINALLIHKHISRGLLAAHCAVNRLQL